MRSRSVSSSRSLVLEARARHMRFHLTPSEARLWAGLRGGRLGVAFRRQVVVGRFIVDFLAPEVCLIVEVDGGYHARCQAADERRDAALRRWGYRLVRLPAELVERDMPAALAFVREALGR